VMKAYMRAFDYMLANQNNLDETLNLIVKYTNTKRSVVDSAWKITPHPYPPYADIETMKLQAVGLVEGGKIKKDVVKNYDKFIAETYHPEFLFEYLRNLK